jgi:hypothetical protein
VPDGAAGSAFCGGLTPAAGLPSTERRDSDMRAAPVNGGRSADSCFQEL